MIEVIGQVIGFIAVAFAIASYQMKTRKGILIVLTTAAALFCVNYLMIGAITGFALNAVSIVRNVAYHLRPKSRALPIIFAVIMLIIGVITWEAWYSLLITVALAINSVCAASSNPQNFRRSLLVTCPLVLIYDIITVAMGGIVNESLSMISAIVGLVRYRKKSDGVSENNT